MSGHRPAKKMPRLRGAAAQAHKAKVAREQSEEPAAEQPAPKAATPRKSHVKATGKGKKRVEVRGGVVGAHSRRGRRGERSTLGCFWQDARTRLLAAFIRSRRQRRARRRR